jgi:hypothetical protein
VSLRRHAARRDNNEATIVDALEAIGIVVHRLSAPGLPDLLTYNPRAIRAARWLPIEVKQPGEGLTIPQQVTALYSPYPIVSSVAEALALFGVQDA